MTTAVKGHKIRDTRGRRSAHGERGGKRVIPLAVDEVPFFLPDGPIDSRRQRVIGPGGPSAEPAQPSARDLIAGGQSPPGIGGQDGHPNAGSGQPGRHLIDMGLDAADRREGPGRDHGHPQRSG